ncbi:MAG: hypothetical protein Q9179_008001 [Wetmoreana sp. 5 TL-2023]
MATALDHYMKAVVSNIVGRVRSDLPGINSVGGGVIVTSAHANAMASSKGGKIKEKGAEGRDGRGREVLSTGDMRVAIQVGGWGELAQMPTVVKGLLNGWNEGILEGWAYDSDQEDEEWHEGEDEMQRGGKRPAMRPMTNGIVTNGLDVHMDDFGEEEEESWGWAGGAASERRQLGNILDECLAIGQ